MTPPAQRPGLLLVHKARGETSFERLRVITEAWRKSGASFPMSHAGALDPFAEGLLIVLVGPANRLMEALHVAPKRYVAEVAWGVETDTGDEGGKPVPVGETQAPLPPEATHFAATEAVVSPDVSSLTPERLDAALQPFLGWREQVPPATSNKRVEGERAYRKAHRGEAVELPASRVYLHEARWTAHALPGSSTLELVCGGGYYVRALVRDLGRALGVGAHLRRLHRTQIGPWADPSGEPVAVVGRALLPWLDSRDVTDFEAGALRQGGGIRPGKVAGPEWPLPEGFSVSRLPIRAFHKERLIALLTPELETLRTSVWLRGL